MKAPERIRCIVVYIIYVVLICCLQVSFPAGFTLYGQSIDWMLVFTCLVGYYYGFKDGVIIGLIVGIIRDYFSAPSIIGIDGTVMNSVGFGAFALFLAAVVSSTVFSKRITRKFIFGILSVFICTLGYKIAGHLMIYIWYSFFTELNYSLSFYQVVIESIFPQIVLNLLGAVVLIFLMRFVGPYKNGKKPGLIDDVYENEGVTLWLK